MKTTAETKVTLLESSTYENISKHCKVFNLSTLNYHLNVYLNPETVREAYFIEAKEIGPKADNSKIFPDTFRRVAQCWLQVNMEYLNTRVGKHTYKLDFVDRFTDTDFSLYFSYIIQDDTPEKPYVYMKKDGASTPVVSNADLHPGFTLYQDN